MKNLIFIIISFFALNSYAQKQLKELTFDDCQNPSVFEKIKNNTKILRYTSANGAIIEIGDTLIIGTPSGSITTTTIVDAEDKVGAAEAHSKTKNSFTTIFMGIPPGFVNPIQPMNTENTDAITNANATMQGELVVVSKMKVFHKGSKKKPLGLIMFLGEPNGRAFGYCKYMSVFDYEKSVIAGEIKSLNAPMTRKEAIAKLKESKDLLDLGLLKQEEYDKIKSELTPIIMKE